jgi:YebC/PmpR family DNA-binding regulatory protein
MWRRHSIANKKAAWDAEKSKNYARVWKLLEIAARQWGKDPTMNPQLELMLQKARQYNLPRDVVDKAIKKWAWEIWWDNLQEVLYEWYGPSGSALYIKCITSSTNRTSSNIRSTLAKMWGAIAEPGAVSWQFNLKGVIIINGIVEVKIVKWNEVKEVLPYDVNKLEEDLLALDIEDFDQADTMCRIITSREAFIGVRKALDGLGYSITEADLQYLPQNEISLSDADYETFEKIVEALEEDEDVDSVYHNVG